MGRIGFGEGCGRSHRLCIRVYDEDNIGRRREKVKADRRKNARRRSSCVRFRDPCGPSSRQAIRLILFFFEDFSKHLLSLDDLKPEHSLRFFTFFSGKVFDNVTKASYIILVHTKNPDHSGPGKLLFKPQ